MSILSRADSPVHFDSNPFTHSEHFEPSPQDWADAFSDTLNDDLFDLPPNEVGEPLVPFSEWVSEQASYYRSLESEAASWLAGRLEALADMVRALDANGPDVFEDRLEAVGRPGVI